MSTGCWLASEADDIAHLHLRDTFVTDVLGALAVQYLDCIANVEGGVLRFMRFFRLFKLMRLRELGTMIKTLESLSHGSFLISDVKLVRARNGAPRDLASRSSSRSRSTICNDAQNHEHVPL